MTRLHPHLKSFIRSTVLAEMTGPSDNYKWKDALFREVISSVIDNVNETSTDSLLKEEIKKEISKRREEINKALDMVENTLKNIPIDVLKKVG